jgi:endonuclease/exonuclease/phosphatase (EEP) superfamily protein YafD
MIVFNIGGDRAASKEIAIYLRGRDPDLVILSDVLPKKLSEIEGELVGYKVIAQPREDAFGIAVFARDSYLVSGHVTTMSNLPTIELTIAKNADTYSVLAVHAPAPLSHELSLRRDEMLALAAGWARRQTGNAIVAGDLSTTPWSFAFRSLVSEGNLRDSQQGHGLQASWPATGWLLAIPIDHCLHSTSLTSVFRQLGPPNGSDHRPVDVILAPQS